MPAKVKFWAMLIAISCVVFEQMTEQAPALTVEVAKKCNALAAKAFPPREIGNPAAGVIGGGKNRQKYYRECIENEGNVDHNSKEAK